jgi:hypothetical protein
LLIAEDIRLLVKFFMLFSRLIREEGTSVHVERPSKAVLAQKRNAVRTEVWTSKSFYMTSEK